MSKYLKVVWLFITLMVFSISIIGCSSGNVNKEEDFLPEMKTLDPVTLTFCFFGYGSDGQPRNLSSINEMLEELNKKTGEALKATIKFQWLPYENYDAELINLLKSENGPDAFFTYNIDELHNAGLIKDITDLLPQFAPQYFSLLKESWGDEMRYAELDHKTFGILNNGLYPPQYFIIARQDMVEKYAPNGISSFEDYGRFMQVVKEKEKDMVPGYVNSYNFLDAYMMGNGYFRGNGTGLYYRWNFRELTQIPIETTEEFRAAYELYKQWKENKLILDANSREYGTLVQNGNLASILQSGLQMHSSYYLNTNYKYRTYPLYMDSMYMKSPLTYLIGISENSSNTERVLMFIEWLHSSQENYDLLQYGIKDKHYKLTGNVLDISGLDNNNTITDWSGSVALRNYTYDRPYPFEPENYKEFLEKCLNNTISYEEVYDKFGYDIDKYNAMSEEEKNLYKEGYEKIREFLEKRSNIFFEFINQIDAGNFTKTLNEMMEEQGGKSSTDKLLEYNAASLEKLRK